MSAQDTECQVLRPRSTHKGGLLTSKGQRAGIRHKDRRQRKREKGKRTKERGERGQGRGGREVVFVPEDKR